MLSVFFVILIWICCFLRQIRPKRGQKVAQTSKQGMSKFDLDREKFDFDSILTKQKFDPHPRQGQRWESSTSNLTLFNVHSDQFTAQFSSNGAVHGSIRPEIKSSQGSEKTKQLGRKRRQENFGFRFKPTLRGSRKKPKLSFDTFSVTRRWVQFVEITSNSELPYYELRNVLAKGFDGG